MNFTQKMRAIYKEEMRTLPITFHLRDQLVPHINKHTGMKLGSGSYSSVYNYQKKYTLKVSERSAEREYSNLIGAWETYAILARRLNSRFLPRVGQPHIHLSFAADGAKRLTPAIKDSIVKLIRAGKHHQLERLYEKYNLNGEGDDGFDDYYYYYYGNDELNGDSQIIVTTVMEKLKTSTQARQWNFDCDDLTRYVDCYQHFRQNRGITDKKCERFFMDEDLDTCMALIQFLVEEHNLELDMHEENFMWRGQQVVFTDPVCD